VAVGQGETEVVELPEAQ
jgi:hypothetical protein